MRELHLFAGAGGGILGSKLLGHEVIGYVEFNEYCQQILAQRIQDGILDRAPIFTDVREFLESGAAEQYRGIADVVAGGFPCQPFSVAGKQQAGNDERDMWPATIEVIRRVRPRWAFLENVPGLLSANDDVCGTYFGRILRDLAEAGYDAEWTVLGADDVVGAPHRRKRLWILAHAGDRRCNGRFFSDRSRPQGKNWTEEVRGSNWFSSQLLKPDKAVFERIGIYSARDDGILDDVAHQLDRLKAIGNGQVPAVAAAAWCELMDRFYD